MLIIKNMATIHGYTKDEVYEAINRAEIRRQWDKNYNYMSVVEVNEKEGYEIIYSTIKVQYILIYYSHLQFLSKTENSFIRKNHGITFQIKILP